ncbi:tetratricopeptide repeat protein [Candidatus Margulisiibacteriota bacterium]
MPANDDKDQKENTPAVKTTEQAGQAKLGWWHELSRKQKILLGLVWLIGIVMLVRVFNPFRAEWYYREGYNFDAAKRYKEAAQSMEKSVKLAPLETFYGVFLGKIYENLARQAPDKEEKLAWAQKAEDMYLRILAISPRNPWYHNRMAEIYRIYSGIAEDPIIKKQYLVSSDAKVHEAASLDENNALFQMSLAYMYHRHQEFDKALALYEKVLEIEPKFVEAYFNMGDIWRQKGRIDKTIEMYEKIISVNPTFKNVHLSLGRIYYSQGKLKAAELEFVEEIKANKRNVMAYQSLGALLMRQKNWGMAIRIYNRILQIEPKQTLSRQYLAQCYYSLGMVDEAIEELKLVLAAEPNNSQVKRNLQLMQQVKAGPKKKAPAKTTTKSTTTTEEAPAATGIPSPTNQ